MKTAASRHHVFKELDTSRPHFWLLVGLMVLVIFGFALFKLVPPSISQPAATTTAASGSFDQSIVQSHFQNLENLNPGEAISDYSQNASVVWSGNTLSFAGSYNGIDSVRNLLVAFLSSTTRMMISSGGLSSLPSGSPNVAMVNGSIFLSGENADLGYFNGNVNAQYRYVHSDGKWLISEESWNFKSFSTQYSGGATTFPQWQTSGPPLSQRYSESPFKNWVYFYGGASAVIAVVAFMATMPILIWLRRREERLHRFRDAT